MDLRRQPGRSMADDILRAIRQRRDDGMTRTDIYNFLGRHRASDQIGAALQLLVTEGKIRSETRETGGRPSETFLQSEGAAHDPRLPKDPPTDESKERKRLGTP